MFRLKVLLQVFIACVAVRDGVWVLLASSRQNTSVRRPLVVKHQMNKVLSHLDVIQKTTVTHSSVSTSYSHAGPCKIARCDVLRIATSAQTSAGVCRSTPGIWSPDPAWLQFRSSVGLCDAV